MATRQVAVGLHLAADEFGQETFFDLVQRRNNGTEVVLSNTMTTGYLWHKTDTGRSAVTWQMSDVYFAFNLGGAQGTVTVAYAYSDVDYDIADSGERGLLAGLMSGFMSVASLHAVPVQVGRFRYLQFQLVSASGAEDPIVHEWGATQFVTFAPMVENVVTFVQGVVRDGERAAFGRKTTPTLDFVFALSADLTTRMDISGGTVTFVLSRSVAQANEDGAVLVGPLSCSVDNGPQGEASLTMAQADTDLREGIYIGQVELTLGSYVLRETFQVEVLGTML